MSSCIECGRSFAPFSPLVIGYGVETDGDLPTANARKTTFSPLVIGYGVETDCGELSPGYAVVLSVPLLSGMALKRRPKAAEALDLVAFSPLVIGYGVETLPLPR